MAVFNLSLSEFPSDDISVCSGINICRFCFFLFNSATTGMVNFCLFQSCLYKGSLIPAPYDSRVVSSNTQREIIKFTDWGIGKQKQWERRAIQLQEDRCCKNKNLPVTMDPGTILPVHCRAVSDRLPLSSVWSPWHIENCVQRPLHGDMLPCDTSIRIHSRRYTMKGNRFIPMCISVYGPTQVNLHQIGT